MPRCKRPMMRHDPERHHRHSIRLKGHDYTQPGAYFVTICTRGRECLFGKIVDGEMRLNDAGEIAQRGWEDIPRHFPLAELEAFVIMPNHLHGIICRGEASAVPQTTCAAKTKCRRGEKSFAPTTTTTPTVAVANDRFNRPRAQNRCDQMVSVKHQPPFRLATWLPRSRCSKRGRTESNPRIHLRQSRQLGRG